MNFEIPLANLKSAKSSYIQASSAKDLGDFVLNKIVKSKDEGFDFVNFSFDMVSVEGSIFYGGLAVSLEYHPEENS